MNVKEWDDLSQEEKECIIKSFEQFGKTIEEYIVKPLIEMFNSFLPILSEYFLELLKEYQTKNGQV